jgi:pilus assembly protein CpaC
MKRLALAASLTVLLLAPAVRAQTKHHPATRPTDPPAAPPGAEPEVHPQISRDLALAVGETKTISAVGVANYSEGTPGVVEVKLTGDASQFIVVGQRPGSTSLVLIGRDGTQTNVAISVFARSPQQVEAEIGELIDGYTGLRVRRVGSRFFIEGGVSNEGDLKRVELIAHLYPGQVESLVGVGAGAADRSTDIRIDVFFVQYSKDSSYNVGLTWPSVISTTGLQSSLGYNFITQTPSFQAGTSVNQPLPGLDIASAHGWAKVLKQATVITTNGVEAKLGNGGEQNFSIANGLTSTIRPISFGTNVTVVPRFDPQTRDLEVKVDADISDLTASAAGTSLPGRQTANLTTLVHLKLGQSIVLSGIHTLSKIHAVSGIPGLSQIPILGLLFASHSDTEQETEGAIFIVPSVMDSADKGALELIREATRKYDHYSGDISTLRTFERNPAVSATPPPPVKR